MSNAWDGNWVITDFTGHSFVVDTIPDWLTIVIGPHDGKGNVTIEPPPGYEEGTHPWTIYHSPDGEGGIYSGLDDWINAHVDTDGDDTDGDDTDGDDTDGDDTDGDDTDGDDTDGDDTDGDDTGGDDTGGDDTGGDDTDGYDIGGDDIGGGGIAIGGTGNLVIIGSKWIGRCRRCHSNYGYVFKGSDNVLANGIKVGRIKDKARCSRGHVGYIITGSKTVMVNGLGVGVSRVSRVGGNLYGLIITGAPTVITGG